MVEIYEIYADESWTHGGVPQNRYWRIFGGIFGKQSDLDRLDTELRHAIARHGLRGEVKWGHISAANLGAYIELVDILFQSIERGEAKYRQMFLDRSFVRVPRHDEAKESELTVQFKLYYQFLKHAFGIEYLPPALDDDSIDLLIRLDSHTSQQHTARLTDFARNLPHFVNRPDLSVFVTFVNSKRVPRLQICDLLMGAAGSYGNKMHKRRRPGQRGMTHKQKLRLELAKHIYDGLRAIDADDRGSRAFSWFESTGHNGSIENRYHHKVRIWKFMPHRHVRDAGWQNDNLDAQGRYLGPIIRP